MLDLSTRLSDKDWNFKHDQNFIKKSWSAQHDINILSSAVVLNIQHKIHVWRCFCMKIINYQMPAHCGQTKVFLELQTYVNIAKRVRTLPPTFFIRNPRYEALRVRGECNQFLTHMTFLWNFVQIKVIGRNFGYRKNLSHPSKDRAMFLMLFFHNDS